MWAPTAGIVEAVSNVGLDVVAQGVETAHQANALRSMNCRYAQGFFFHRPSPAATIDEILSAGAVGRRS